MSKDKDIRGEVRHQMDRICANLTREANKLKGADTLTTRLEVVKVVTGYLSMANREPAEAEGGDFAEYRRQLGNGAGGGGGPRDPDDGPEGDPAEEPTGEPDDPDAPEADDPLPTAAE